MLRIRLRRVGKKKQPMYRIVVADSHAPRDGAFVESLGHYNPLTEPSTIVIDSDRAKHWLDKGAMPSERVWKILALQGIADLPVELQRRIELGGRRAAEAKEKAKAEAAQAKEEAPAAEAPAAEAPAAEAPAAEAPAAEAETQAEAPAAEAEAQAEAPAAEAEAQAEAPAAEAEEEAKE